MYISRSRWKTFCIAVLISLLGLFLFTRGPLRLYDRAESVKDLVLDDPVELLLTEDDLTPGSEAAINATLGFQKILALSTRPSWRTRGLEKISAFAGLQIDVIEPPQPKIKAIEDFLALGPGKAVKPDRGSTLAWLGHLAVLQNIITSGYDTALIVEDDVDFDIVVKSQMRKLAVAVRHFTNTSNELNPYGTSWDVMWLGHCGERWNRARSSLQYPDSSRINQDQYIGWKEASFETIRDNHRLIQWASGPTCTFAYAVTLSGARKILALSSKGRSTAFDTELSDLCIFDSLRCITVTPQIFVHYVPNATAADYVSEIDRENNHVERPADDSHLDQEMGHTQNIVKSARCMALFGDSCLPSAEKKL